MSDGADDHTIIQGLLIRLCRRLWFRRLAARLFFRCIPHGRILGFRIVEVEPAALTAELPYRQCAIGHPWAGFVHGGAITALVDQTCGAVASLAVSPPAQVATLDLRLDWLRPATPGRPIRARAECVSVKRHVIFVRCSAYHNDPAEPIALATGTFMRSGPLLGNLFQRPSRSADLAANANQRSTR